MRDLTRARQDGCKALKASRQLLLAFLLRHGYRYHGKSNWTKAHVNWLSEIKMPHRAQQIVLQEYIHAVNENLERVQRLTDQIRQLVPSWQHMPLVKALQAMRGASLIVAVTIVAEIGDLTRFDSPKQLMAYLGLVPSQHSSGATIRHGSITKAGNGHVRKVLVEAAQAYSHPARETRTLLVRMQGLPQGVRNTAWKAQVRLCTRFRRLVARGINRNKVVTAIARELAGFMWAIACEMLPA